VRSHGAAPQESRVLLDRAIRALALAKRRVEEARQAASRLDEVISRGRELVNELAPMSYWVREATGVVARLERRQGAPPERMVIALKDIVEDTDLDPTVKHEIKRQVIEWGIDAYYAAA